MNQADKLYTTLVRSHMLLTESDERFFEQHRLGKTRYYALLHIDQQPGVSLSELSKRLLCTKGNTTRIIKGLEQEGYIARRTDPQDSRAQCLVLTERGQKLLIEATHTFYAHKQALFACLDENAAMSLVEILDSFNTHCSKQLRPE